MRHRAREIKVRQAGSRVRGYPHTQKNWGCLKSRLLFRQPVEFKIKSLYCKDLILNIAYKIKEAVQKLKFLDSPLGTGCAVVPHVRALGEPKTRD